MKRFNFHETEVDGVYIVESVKFEDDRGFFWESYNEKEFVNAGLDLKFIQDNESFSVNGVLRGLHFQKNHSQGKLVRCGQGEIFDVAVDLRNGSSTYGKAVTAYLTSENRLQLYIPAGFAHGFLVVSEDAQVIYKTSEFYHPEDEGGIMWNDPILDIKWPIERVDKLLVSEKDKKYQSLSDQELRFAYEESGRWKPF